MVFKKQNQKLGKSIKKKPKVVTTCTTAAASITSGAIAQATALAAAAAAAAAVSTPKTPNTSITTITPTAVSTPITVAAKKDDSDLSAKLNNIVVASNALPHGTKSVFLPFILSLFLSQNSNCKLCLVDFSICLLP